MPITLPVSYTTVSLMWTVNPDIGSMTTLTSAQQANYAGHAQALVNAKIARYYSLPFTSEVPLLQTLTTEIAIYLTVSRRPYPRDRLDFWLARYQEAFGTLDLISAGELLLVDASGTTVLGRSDIAEVWSDKKDYVPTFSELPPDLAFIDSEKTDAELDRRELDIPSRYLK